jgi:hypothetical protein
MSMVEQRSLACDRRPTNSYDDGVFFRSPGVVNPWSPDRIVPLTIEVDSSHGEVYAKLALYEEYECGSSFAGCPFRPLLPRWVDTPLGFEITSRADVLWRLDEVSE